MEKQNTNARHQAMGRHHMQGRSMTSMPSYSNSYVTQGPRGSGWPTLTTEQRIAQRDQNLSRQSTKSKGGLASSKSTKHLKTRNSSATFQKAGNEANKSSELLFTMQASVDRPRQSTKQIHGESGKRDFPKHTDYFAARDSILGFEHQKAENLHEEDGENMTQTPVDESFSSQPRRTSKRKDSATMNNEYITYISRANKVDDTNFQEMIKKRQLDVQKRLASIQQQVELQTQELEKQRMNNRFSGLPMDTFKPYKRTKDGRIVEEGPGGVNNILELQSPDPKRYTSMSAQNQSMYVEAQPSDMKSQSILESGPNAPAKGNDFDNTIQESLFLQDDTSNDMDNKKPVNSTDFISGGLHNYRQSQQFTVKSVIRKMSTEQPRTTKNQESSPQLTKSAESHRALKKQTSQVILNNLFDKDFMSQTIPQTQRYSAKDINKPFDRTLKLDEEVRNELLAGGLDVVLHPQDRKRLGLEPERPGEYTVRGSRSPRVQQQPPKKPTLSQQQKPKTVKKMANIEPVESPMKTKKTLQEVTEEANERLRLRNERSSKNQNMASMKSLKNVQSVKGMAAEDEERGAEEDVPSPQPAQDAAKVQMQVYPDDYRYVMDTTQPLLHDISHISQVDSSFTEPRRRQAKQPETVSDQEDTEIIDAKLDQMRSKDETLMKQRQEILEILVKEESMLYKYATQTQEDLQAHENASARGQDQDGEDIVDYKTILQKANVDKIRVMFFVRQLQITFILTRALIRVFVPGLLQKFQVKFQHMCQNIHQNFLLMIDMILKEFLLQSQTGVPYGQLNRTELFSQQQQSERGPNITKSNEYRLLRSLTDTRLRNKEKQSKTLTSFRQNNEVNIQNLKKIVKYVIDSYTQDCIAFKVLAFDIQEIMRHHLSNAIANMNSNHFEALTEHPDSSISAINKNITQRTNLLASVSGSTAASASPKQQESKSKVQSIAQNNAGQTTLKRGKSAAKLHGSAGPSVKTTSASVAAGSAQNQHHNSSILSAHVYGSSTAAERQPQNSQITPHPPQRINDLINAANQGLSQGVLAGRKSPTKRAGKAQQAKNLVLPDESIPNQTKHNFQSQAIQNAKGGMTDLNRSQQAINRPNSPNYMNRTKAAISKTKKPVVEAAQRTPQLVGQKGRQFQSNSALGMAQAARRVQGHHEYKRGSAGSGQAISPVKQHVGASSFVSPVKQSTIQRKYGYSQQQSPGGGKSQSRPMSRQQESKHNQSLNQAQAASKRSSPSKAIAASAASQRSLQKRSPVQTSQQQRTPMEEAKTQHRRATEKQSSNKGSAGAYQHSQFMHMPETLAFIMKCQQQEQEQQESEREYKQWNEAGSLRSEPMNDSIAHMLANIQNQHVTNVDKSINFYGPVINHVYPSAMPDVGDGPEVGGYGQIGSLQQLHGLSNPEFEAPAAFDGSAARHGGQGDRQREIMTSVKKVNRQRDDKLIKEHEKIRFMSNSQLNCYEDQEPVPEAAHRRATAGAKNQANTVARHPQKQERVPVKSSVIDLNSDSSSQLGLARVNKRLTQSVLASQSDMELPKSPSKVGTRAGSGIGTGTKNLAIRQKKLAQMHQQKIQDYNDQDLSQFKVPQEIFATPPVGNLMKTHELKMNFPPRIQPPVVRNTQSSMDVIAEQPAQQIPKPRPSALTRNDDHNTFGNSFKAASGRPCLTASAQEDEYQFEDPVPQQLMRIQQAQDTTSRREMRQRELSEFEQIEAEVFSGSKIGDADANFTKSKIEQDSIQDVSYIPAVNDSCFVQDFDVRKTEFKPFKPRIEQDENDIVVDDQQQNNYEISLIKDEDQNNKVLEETEDESLGLRPPVESSVNDEFAFEEEESDNTERRSAFNDKLIKAGQKNSHDDQDDELQDLQDDEQSQLEQLEIQNEQFSNLPAKLKEQDSKSATLSRNDESAKVTPNRRTQLKQSSSGRMTMDDFDHNHCATTDQRKVRYSMRSNTNYEENALTIPRKQKMNKRIFFGEYDATAEEEMSLINSQIGHQDRVANFLGSNASSHQQSPSHFDSPGGTQSNTHSPGVRLNEVPLNSGRHSLIQLIPVRQGSYESNENIHETPPNGKFNLAINLESLNQNQQPEEFVVQPMLSQREIEQTRRTIISKQMTTPRQQQRSSYDEQDFQTHAQTTPQVIESKPEVRAASDYEDEAERLVEDAPFQKIQESQDNLIAYACESNISVSESPGDKASAVHNQETDQETEELPPAEMEEVDDEQAQIDREFRELRELVTIPYLPPLSEGQKLPKKALEPYTLVLDLDETLIHFEVDEDVNPEEEEPGYYLIRPGAVRFLNELSEYYEIVVFTAAMPDYADWILDNIDRAGRISHRLYRQHTTPHEDYAIKDLRNLGRDLSKTIIIDNLAENFNYTTPANGIWVESWYDDMDCKVLGLLIPFLKDIVISALDVRCLLTEHIKETFLYRMLDEVKRLPSCQILLAEEEEYQRQIAAQGSGQTS